ncbi:MAG TPA: ATPase, T2SS/T4P/T4SS family, partial [Myxococcota bacterium]
MPVDPQVEVLLDALLQVSAQNGCSDLHLRANQTAFGRGNGRVASIGGPVLTSEHIHALVAYTAGYDTQGNAEYSCERGSIRLRCTAFVERGVWGLTIRLIPLMIPTFADLRLPPVVKVLSSPRPGLVLVTGPTGSGKSTTAAAMLRAAGQEPIHILTLEDPVEHRIVDVPACITQREVPRERLGESLKDALRLDPDVIYIGEIRDAATLEVALHAAETGIAVLSTFHTHSAVHTIQRLSAMLPEGMSKERVAEAVRGVITQRLLRRRGSNGRVVATEVL